MNICVIGTGYVGLVSGTCFSDTGNQVTCVDLDQRKVDMLKNGEIPIYEPGLKELVEKNVKAGRLTFTTNLTDGMKEAEVIFVAVGTPPKENGEADLQYIEAVASQIGEQLNDYKVIVTKSTVPVGTGQKIKDIIKSKTNVEFDVASNPEFLREGSAIYDTQNMERAVIGVESKKAEELLTKLHEPFQTEVVVTNIETAEMIKYASNAFLATKISFINEIANICEQVNADVTEVARGMGLDSRIGSKFLQAGIGYGGSCFPKDTRAIIKIAEQVGYDFKVVRNVEEVNNDQRYRMVEKLKQALGSLEGKKIAVIGLAFKPNTDDMRDAPSIDIIREIKKLGGEVVAFDPVASDNAKKVIEGLVTAADIYDTISEADAVLILTEWKEVQQIDLAKVKKVVKEPIIIDGRNVFSLDAMEQYGFYYDSIGRKTVDFR
ncbi:UDP-glucose dehydrogenase family protein [Halalkalibacter krulwichiae]|uniref:UDP-glucose 6-dehydrogenase n=1 Tax=Halalkalibacter krulwichiae TaxID=199441 RepID=A0A1X9MFH1_9BACI|nr:UDP-glucose/GDP-mannose dehydrogenase family protein [Halalkalibacter krulwichiae]ARK32205.1 UDP-glucose 6-dehydrogenase TuaD [Halalkalibacter krulwichiae]